MTPGSTIIYQHLRALASAGQPMPRTTELSKISGVSPGSIASIMERLEGVGLIRVEVMPNAPLTRRTYIVADGTVTAWSLRRNHSTAPIKPRQKRLATIADCGSQIADTPRYAPRTTCWRCGARSDAGCGHILPEWQPGVAA